MRQLDAGIHCEPRPGRERRRYPLWGGELTVPATSEARIEEAMTSPVPVIRAYFRGTASYHRSAQAVLLREHKALVITYIEGGTITLSRSQGSLSIHGPALIIARPSVGYHVQFKSEEGSATIIFQTLLPRHYLAEKMHRLVELDNLSSYESSDALVAGKMIESLFHHGRTMSDTCIAESVRLVSSIAGYCLDPTPIGQPISKKDERTTELLKYIKDNIGDVNLSISLVARRFGISVRYASRILRSTGADFPSIVKNERLRVAKDLMGRIPASAYSITEIAALSGFKTVSHFHRVFKANEGLTPRVYWQQVSRNLANG